MAAGEWSLTLRPDTPQHVTQQLSPSLQGFAHLIVCPARFPDVQASAASLRAIALYVGVFRNRRSRFELSGAGVNIWLGDEEGKGETPFTAISHTNGTLWNWASDLVPAALTAGDLNVDVSPTLTWSAQYISRREALDYVCARFGAEWRVNPDLTLDVDYVDTLYGATPVAMVSPRWDGNDPLLPALRATITPERDVEDFTTGVLVDGGSGTGTASLSPVPYNDGQGNDVIWRRYIDSTSTAAGAETAVAEGQLARFDSARRSIDVTTTTPLPTQAASVGSPVWVYDPVEGIFDEDNQVHFRGEVAFPEATRLVAATWPIPPGCGVYFAKSDGTDGVVDLSDWYVPEFGTSQLTLDKPRRRLANAMRAEGIKV